MIDWERFNKILEGLPFTLTEEQLTTCIDVLGNKNNHLIIGKPGVGKSVIIDILKKYLGKKVVVGSTTGISNQRLFNGKGGVGSMHRIFSLPITLHNDAHKKKVTPFTSAVLGSNHELEYIMIDEAGFLLNSDYLELIYWRLERFNRKYRDRPRRDIKLILVGDFAQIPVFFNYKEAHIMKEKYESPYFFKSNRFRSMNFQLHNLVSVNRTKDKTFLACLDAMRYGETGRYKRLCEWVNQKMYYGKVAPPDLPVMTCWNAEADRVNFRNLEANPNPEFIYYSVCREEYDIKHCPVGEFVKLKVGAKVMTLINDGEDNKYNNGSLGTITFCQSDGVYIRFDHTGEEVFVGFNTFEQTEPFEEGTEVSSEGKIIPKIEYKVVGTCDALPVSLAYGLSVHKNQGSTISSPCIVDLGSKGFNNNSNFGEALAYVALSRFEKVEDIYLRFPLKPEHIKVNSEILNWLESVKE